MAKRKASNENRKETLEELQNLQERADELQDQLEALWLRAQRIQRDLAEEFYERFREQGMELTREQIASIRRELRDIRDKVRTIQGLQSRYTVFKDLIEMKKSLIETARSDDEKKILTRQKTTEILLKNRIIIEIIFEHIFKIFEYMLLRAKLAR